MLRIGVDIGGTFTDLMLLDEGTGGMTKAKVLSTPRAPEEGLLLACAEAGAGSEEISDFVHGTTIVTNLVIQRSGARVGLLTTRGFRDILLMQTGQRAESFNLQWERQQPLVPRQLIMELSERLDAHGQVLQPLDRAEVVAAVRSLLQRGVQSIAVCLYNSYLDGSHERIVREVVREEAPEVFTSLSSEVDPRIREYPRASTTVLNAYAMPRIYGYVDRLDRASGLERGIKYMHSGGGVVPSTIARQKPVMLAKSGPAAGVLAASFLGDQLGIPNIITADMGGTSFDVCVIRGGVPEIKDSSDVVFAIPLRSDGIDVHSIGAGGGSVAWIDEGGALRVGPRSAGAAPGPACYNFGGTEPTVTDANMVLGLLNPANLLGGRLKVDPQRSWDALKAIADHYRTSIPEAARGIYQIVNAGMAQAIRQITVEKGIDPREFTIVAFGGAGGQHAVDVAKELDVPSVLFPVNASTLSALGMLTANLKYTQSRTKYVALAECSASDLVSELRQLEAEALAFLKQEEALETGVGVDWYADVRYIGQSYELRVPLSRDRLTTEQIHQEFERVYRERYGMVLGDPAEIVNIGATAIGRIHPPRLPKRDPASGDERPQAQGYRKTAFYEQMIPIFGWDALKAGMVLESPCIIEADDSTIFIPEGCESRVDEYGNVRTTVTTDAQPASMTLDPFTAEVIRGYLLSTVEEMVRSTTAVAYSSTFADRLDFTCGIFDADGRLIAQARGIPVHAGTMMDSMLAILDAFEGTFKDGDAIVFNDVYAGGSHQPDVMVARPIFFEDQLIGFAANRGHWTDVGGMAAGGFAGTARHVVQEALTIPPAKLYEGGVLNPTVKAFILKNVRIPHQIWGDLQSQMVANVTADTRLKGLIAKYGLGLVLEGMHATLEYGARRFRQKLLAMPDGVGTASDILDTDGITDRRYKLNVTVEKRGDRLRVDCTGTSEQEYAVINCSEIGSKGNLYVGILAVVDPDGNINSGVAEMVDLVLPKGTIVNPRYPAPVSAGWYAMATLADCVVRAFGSWLPDRVAASSHGDRDNTTFGGFDPRTGAEWLVYSGHHGGGGARATKDGESVAPHMAANSKIASLESWERQFPLLFVRWEMVTDSGGAGEYRGGLAGRLEVKLLDDALVTAAATHHIVPAKGIFGGMDGACHAFSLTRNGVTRSVQEFFGLPSPSKFSNLPLKAGDIYRLETGGGGGYGDPLEREVERVVSDVVDGYVSVEKARTEYGVVIDPDTGRADANSTAELRKRRTGKWPSEMSRRSMRL